VVANAVPALIPSAIVSVGNPEKTVASKKEEEKGDRKMKRRISFSYQFRNQGWQTKAFSARTVLLIRISRIALAN